MIYIISVNKKILKRKCFPETKVIAEKTFIHQRRTVREGWTKRREICHWESVELSHLRKRPMAGSGLAFG